MKTQCKESDLKVEVIRKEKEPEESVITNSFFNILIVLTIIGTGLIIQKIGESRNALLLLKEPSYKFPLYSDIYMAFIAVAILIVIFSLINHLITDREDLHRKVINAYCKLNRVTEVQ